jgi:DNA polymerase III delta prime subunit
MRMPTPPAAPRAGAGAFRLTAAQEAAVARVGCAVTDRDAPSTGGPTTGGATTGNSVVLLCGPAGVGKTTVLHAVRAGLVATCSSDIRTAADWSALLGTRAAVLPDVVIADDAHESSCGDILRLLNAVRSRRPRARLVLAGEGRLLSVVARDGRIGQAVGMRAILRPFTPAETRAVVARFLDRGAPSETERHDDPLVETARSIHEIAAGMPGAVVRIAGQAAIMADTRPDRRLTAADIELVHRRLSLSAA